MTDHPSLYPCHELYFPTPESLFQYLHGGWRQVQDLRDPHKAYRRVFVYSQPYFQVRDLRAPYVRWRLCKFELPEDMRYLQPLGMAPEEEIRETYEYRRINFTPTVPSRKRSYGPFMDGIDARIERWNKILKAFCPWNMSP